MVGFRPRLDARYLDRPRLLQLLPEDEGFMVWLQAPSGYGKSVLAAQWAAEREAQGWRVLWLADVGDAEVRTPLATLLDLPPYASWQVLAERLGQEKTLLVLEDVTEADLTPFTQAPRGLVLVSSHGHLALEGCPLVHLEAEDLAFSQQEAEAFVGEPGGAEQLRQRTGGWPLLLDLSLRLDAPAERSSLAENVRRSLSPELWEEALLLAALPHLPEEVASDATRKLAALGVAQAASSGYRLPSALNEALCVSNADEMRAAVETNARRLPPLLQGRAFEKVGLHERLGEVLADERNASFLKDPAAVVRWDALAPGPRGPRRIHRAGEALCEAGRWEEGLELLVDSARRPDIEPLQRLKYLMQAVFYASWHDPAQALDIAELAERLFDAADDEAVATFLTNKSRLFLSAGEWDKAEQTLEQALARFPRASDKRYVALSNLAHARWHRVGDLELALATREQHLAINKERDPSNVPGDLWQLGQFHFFLGEKVKAAERFREVQGYAKANPLIALAAEAMRAHLERDLSTFPSLVAQVDLWGDTYVQDIAYSLWARTLREVGAARTALERLAGRAGFFAAVERGLALHALGRAGALTALPDQRPATEREQRLHLGAARYLITGEEAALDELLAMTLVGERILPGILPLASLPRHRPELSRCYAIEAVLEAGWPEAVAPRLDEVPPLEVRVLGGYAVYRSGKPLALTKKHQELLLLMVLGLSREAISEAMWPETPAEKVRNRLDVNLSQLRNRVLEPWRVTTYLDDVKLLRTKADVWDLETALAANEATAVLDLYRGSLAPAIDIGPAVEAREYLHERVMAHLYSHAQAAEFKTAMRFLKAVLQLEPLHEAALQALMALLLRHGRRTEAARLYRSFHARLQADLGLEPAPETKVLLEPNAIRSSRAL